MNSDEAVGWMVVGLINQHYPHPEEPDDDDFNDLLGGGCCIANCGPCKALHWMISSDFKRLDELIRLTGFHRRSWCFWYDELDILNGAWFLKFWDKHKACGVSGGELIPCETNLERNSDGRRCD